MTQNVVMITGGATGIGFALAKKFHNAGYLVVLVGRRKPVLEKAQEQLTGAMIEVADISQQEDRERLVAKYPNLTILVNNAGIQVNGSFLNQNLDEISNELDINLIAPILLTRMFLPHLTDKQESAVINVSSGLALVPKESASIYCASKAAIHNFTKTLRWQLEGTSVRVFELLPPLVDTAMTEGRGDGKINPDDLAEEFWKAFERKQLTIYGGKIKLLAVISRLWPSLAERIMRKG